MCVCVKETVYYFCVPLIVCAGGCTYSKRRERVHLDVCGCISQHFQLGQADREKKD